MTNPLAQAVKSATAANEQIGRHFANVGTHEQDGFVTSAYRLASLEMHHALDAGDPRLAGADVMDMLRTTLDSRVASFMRDVTESGVDEARRQLSFYKIKSPSKSIDLSEQINSARDAVLSRVDAQSATIQAMLLTGAEPEQIIGDADRTGILRWSDITIALVYWTASLFWQAFDALTSSAPSYGQFSKQAIAALDNKTTDCCLRVHSQIQPMGKQFILTGNPRFADAMDWPGFHQRCRTSVALYKPIYDDGLTSQMRADADQVIAERRGGAFVDRHPANAFT